MLALLKSSAAKFLYVSVVSFALLAASGCRIEGNASMDGAPLANHVVYLQGEGLNLSTETDKNGHYSFDQIDAGFYQVSLEGLGLTTQRVDKPSNNTNIKNVNFTIDTKTRRSTNTGDVIGHVDSNGTLVWRGIPYASAPTGTLRWKAARPADAWGGDYWALGFSDPCPQLAHLQLDAPLTKIGSTIGKEDCLYLNVWAPDSNPLTDNEAPRPVMFWIHGGGNTAGEPAIFDGKVLAEKYGVIVVTTSYRLGVLGYFSHPALRAAANEALDHSPNFGTTDLIQALTWVQDNIAAFGGDPNRVMIFGESAGAANVGALLASPNASGLFHRAAMQSGSFGWSTQAQAENFSSEGGASSSAREIVNKLLVADGLAVDSETAKALQLSMTDAELADYLYGKTIEELLAHFDGSRFGMYSYPTLIRDDIIIPNANPYDLFSSGNYNQVPVISGTNRDESKIFMAFDPEFVPGGLPLLIKDKNYFNLAAYYQSTLWRARAVDDFARAASQHEAPVYTYRFDWDEEPKILWVDVAELIGASHFFEIPFIFNTPHTFTVKIASPLLFTKSAADHRQSLSDSMSSYWAAFAYSGDPGYGFNASENVKWNPWTANENEDNIILFDSEADQGIRMDNQEVSINDLQWELQNETGFTNNDQKCETYRRAFGFDNWYYTHCINN